MNKIRKIKNYIFSTATKTMLVWKCALCMCVCTHRTQFYSYFCKNISYNVHIDKNAGVTATQIRHYIAVIAFFHIFSISAAIRFLHSPSFFVLYLFQPGYATRNFPVFGPQIRHLHGEKKIRSPNNNHRHIFYKPNANHNS